MAPQAPSVHGSVCVHATRRQGGSAKHPFTNNWWRSRGTSSGCWLAAEQAGQHQRCTQSRQTVHWSNCCVCPFPEVLSMCRMTALGLWLLQGSRKSWYVCPHTLHTWCRCVRCTLAQHWGHAAAQPPQCMGPHCPKPLSACTTQDQAVSTAATTDRAVSAVLHMTAAATAIVTAHAEGRTLFRGQWPGNRLES